MKDTLPGKLPQKKIVREAAHGYSSYGNQIGLATGYVKEVYHPDYVAKRMEIGAVMGAAPRRAVQRRLLIREISLSYSEDVPDVTVSVVQPVRLKRTNTQSTSVCGAEVRKVMLRPSVRSRDYSAVRKLPTSLKNVTISVQAVCLWQSVN